MNSSLRKKLLKDMILTRSLELMIAKNYKDKEIRCPVHLSIGQEAISAGVSHAITKKDIIFSAHRSHSHYLSKGGSVKGLIGEIYGKISGCAKGVGGSMHLIDLKAGVYGCVPIVGSTIPISVGAAWSNKILKKDSITVVYFGDGATEQGVFYESLNFAKIHKIPILFICENNFYSIYTDYKKRRLKKNNITNISKAMGIKSSTFFGNDVEKVYIESKKAVNYIKKNQEPVLLEFETFRVYEHCGPNIDDNLNYRPKSEIKKWIKLCPLVNYKNKLIKKKILNENQIEKFQNDTTRKLSKIFNQVKKDKFPEKKYLTKYTYV